MYVCPQCNQLVEKQFKCSNCELLLEDRGRVMDYFDDYSAYLEIDGMKLFDGYADDYKNNKCPHVFYCTSCQEKAVYLIPEQNI